MIKISNCIVYVILALGSLTAFAQDGPQDIEKNAKRMMDKVGMELDIAETNLRILLGRQATGMSFPDRISTDKAKLEAALRLLNFEQRYPGVLQKKFGKTNWSQYEAVTQLFTEVADNNDFYYFDNDSRDVGKLEDKLNQCEDQLQRLLARQPAATLNQVKEQGETVIHAAEKIRSDGKATPAK